MNLKQYKAQWDEFEKHDDRLYIAYFLEVKKAKERAMKDPKVVSAENKWRLHREAWKAFEKTAP